MSVTATVGPGQSYMVSVPVHGPLSPEAAEALKTNYLQLYGLLQYVDVFRQVRHTSFHLVLNAKTGFFEISPTCNSWD